MGVGITWGLSWGVIGAGIGLVIGVISPEAWDLTNPIFVWALGMGLYGFVSGVGFGTLLSMGEGRRTIRDLSLGRVAAWGILGSALVPLFFGMMGTFEAGTTTADVVGAMLVTGLLGGTFAPGAVAIARRAELRCADETKLLNSEPSADPEP
jgi:hypothetical protein